MAFPFTHFQSNAPGQEPDTIEGSTTFPSPDKIIHLIMTAQRDTNNIERENDAKVLKLEIQLAQI